MYVKRSLCDTSAIPAIEDLRAKYFSGIFYFILYTTPEFRWHKSLSSDVVHPSTVQSQLVTLLQLVLLECLTDLTQPAWLLW